MVKELPSVGELEARVLQLVWQEQPCTERRIWGLVCQERAVGRTTVLKTMQRLETKGLLKRLPGKGPNRFRAAVDEDRLMPELVRRFVDGILGGSAEPLVAYLANSKRLTSSDVRALKEIARKIGTDSKPS